MHSQSHIDDGPQLSIQDHQGSPRCDSQSSQEQEFEEQATNQFSLQISQSRPSQQPLAYSRDEFTQPFQSKKGQDLESQSHITIQKNTISRCSENEDDRGKDNFLEENFGISKLNAVECKNDLSSKPSNQNNRKIDVTHRSVTEGDSVGSENESTNSSDLKNGSYDLEDNLDNINNNQGIEAGNLEDEDNDYNHNIEDDLLTYQSEKGNSIRINERQTIAQRSEKGTIESEEESYESENETGSDKDMAITSHSTKKSVAQSDNRQESVSRRSAKSSEDLSDESAESYSESDIEKEDTHLNAARKGVMSAKSHASISQKSTGKGQVLKNDTVVPNDDENDDDDDDDVDDGGYDESYDEDKESGSAQVSGRDDVVNEDAGNEEMIPASQTGIDVAGNRSGSITKLDIQDTSKVSFNRTRKR